ncbi:MAG TPA: DUF402 domain-containing protein [Thermomicrobiales bacterium]|nr:DUF402 domain-containing protein [Thermomicrobiales bacterium]
MTESKIVTRDTANAAPFRQPGEQVLLRFTRPGYVYFVVPQTVVRDDDEVTMTFTAGGTPILKRVYPDGKEIPRDLSYVERSRLPVVLGQGVWHPYHTLSITPAGAEYDVRYCWHVDDWSFRGWYVNLQSPLRRVPTGFDSDDSMLDLTVTADGAWAWKDETELAEGVLVGRFSADEAAQIRAVGESVIPSIASRAYPFDGSLVEWRPDPAWPIPGIPDGWDVTP